MNNAARYPLIGMLRKYDVRRVVRLRSEPYDTEERRSFLRRDDLKEACHSAKRTRIV
jgi:hypothetical protein